MPRWTSAAKRQRFAERRVRVDRFGDVADRAAHFDRDDRFGDQLAGAGADDAAAEHALGRRVDEPLGQAVGAAVGDRAAAGLPRDTAATATSRPVALRLARR